MIPGPSLTLHIAGRTYPVASLAEASRMFCAARDKAGTGGRDTPTPLLYDDACKLVGHVSYNGRVWPGRPQDWRPGMRPLAEAAS